MTITDATALKIRCNFVAKVKTYITNKKYKVDPGLDCLLEDFKRTALLSLGIDCLTVDQICDINEYANTLPTLPINTPTITECEDQGDVDIDMLINTCIPSVTLKNTYDNTASPLITLANDTIYQNASINAIFTDPCGTSSTVTVTGGCTSAGCTDADKATNILGISSNIGDYIPAVSYITSLRVYETDATGVLINTPIDLDLDPATSPYYTAHVTDCPGCTTVSSGDVVMSSTNWATAMSTLMDNVSLARYGSTGKHHLTFQKFSLDGGVTYTVRFLCNIRHNPSSNLFGIKRNDANFKWYNGTSIRSSNSSYANSGISTPVRFYKDDFSYTTSCGTTLTPDINNQFFRMYTDDVQSDFNKLVLVTPLGTDTFGTPKLLTFTGATTTNCNTYTLSATFNGTGTVDNVKWYSGETIISTTYSTTVTASGTYQFVLTLDTGCVIRYNISVPSGVVTQILPG